MASSQRLRLRLQAWHALRHAYEHVSAGLAHDLRERAGVAMPQHEVLLELRAASGQLRQRQLLERTTLGQSGLSRLLDRMSRDGLVERTNSLTDRREWDVELTPAGARLVDRAAAVQADVIEHYLGPTITDREAEMAAQILRKAVTPPTVATTQNRADKEPVALGDSILAVTSEAIAVSEAMVIRDALEPLVLEDAARYRTRRDVQDLHTILAQVSRGLASSAAFVDPHWALHLRIGEITPNSSLKELYCSLTARIRDQLELVIPEGGIPDFIHDRVGLHAEIVAAIVDGDEARCRELAIDHQLSNRLRSAGPGRSPRGEHPVSDVSIESRSAPEDRLG